MVALSSAMRTLALLPLLLAINPSARNVQQAADGTQQVSSNISDVQRGFAQTGSASSQVLSTAKMLA
jgi:hypothetical protein